MAKLDLLKDTSYGKRILEVSRKLRGDEGPVSHAYVDKCVPCAKIVLDSVMLDKFPLTYTLLYFKWF